MGKDQSPGKQNSPKEAGHLEEREPLKSLTLLQLHEAYQLKKGEVNPVKLQA
jgi:hypothetical protein